MPCMHTHTSSFLLMLALATLATSRAFTFRVVGFHLLDFMASRCPQVTDKVRCCALFILYSSLAYRALSRSSLSVWSVVFKSKFNYFGDFYFCCCHCCCFSCCCGAVPGSPQLFCMHALIRVARSAYYNFAERFYLKIANLEAAHNASHRDALWACRSAIFK